MIGRTFSHYRILEQIGAGGMGQVFLAEDERLHRKVAFKVLPEAFAADPDRLARFQREARTLAALNHPHIAQIYGVEDSPQVRALVMELVPGESLAARIERGPLPFREALEYARQAADGLSAAHDKGIVHRDLKPANLQVTPEGFVKVLDFGLAKPVGPEGDVAAAATLTSPAQMTMAGLVLGTAAYMSPEQARGRSVDARTDVWALGAVLYEMLVGQRPFPGPTVTDTLAQILEREPDWSKLPSGTPAAVRTLIQRCLKKDARQRLHDIADARFLLEDALAADAGDTEIGGAAIPAAKRSGRRNALPIGLAVLSLGLAGALVWALLRAPAGPPLEPAYVSLLLPADQQLAGASVISPDGLAVAYAAVSEEGPPGPEGNVRRLYYRRLAETAGRALPGTEGGFLPAFSPDGEWIAFVSAYQGRLKKIPIGGGAPIVLAEISVDPTGFYPPVWPEADTILFGWINGSILRIPAFGQGSEIVVPRSALEPHEIGMGYPVALPGGRGTLFWHSPQGAIASWIDGRRGVVLKEGLFPQLTADGDLLVVRQSGAQIDLLAAPFNLGRAEVTKDPASVFSIDDPGAAFSYQLSRTGTLLYTTGRSPSSAGPFSWLSKDPKRTPRIPPGPASDEASNLEARTRGMNIRSPRISPDGRSLIYTSGQISRRLIQADLTTGTSRTLTAGDRYWTAWSRDSRHIFFQERSGEGGYGLAWKLVDGSGPVERLTQCKGWQQPQQTTLDGRFLIYSETGGLGSKTPFDETYDLWLLPLAPRGEPRPLLRTQANEMLPHLSPDDRWMAYVSDETGRNEIWIRPFPEGKKAIQVTQDGGTEPLWAPDGRLLYYRDAGGTRLHALPVTWGAVPQFGPPSITNGYWVAGTKYGRMYDVLPDGSALLMVPAETFGRELRLVFRFDEVIRRKLRR